MIDLTPIFQALIGLLAAIVTYKLIPWIKAHTDEKQQRLIDAAVQTAVFAAEQIYGAGHGDEKLSYALNWLSDKGYNVNRTEVEAAVYELLNDSGIVFHKVEAEDDGE